MHLKYFSHFVGQRGERLHTLPLGKLMPRASDRCPSIFPLLDLLRGPATSE